MKHDGTESYLAYLREVALGIATGPSRMGEYWDDLRDGLAALAWMLFVLCLPLLFPLCPLIAMLARRSDKRQAEKHLAWVAKWKYNIHRNGDPVVENEE